MVYMILQNYATIFMFIFHCTQKLSYLKGMVWKKLLPLIGFIAGKVNKVLYIFIFKYLEKLYLYCIYKVVITTWLLKYKIICINNNLTKI